MPYDTNNPMLLLATACTPARTDTHPLETATPEAARASHAQHTPTVEPSTAKKRKLYKCGVCGRPKRGHFCQPSTLTQAMHQHYSTDRSTTDRSATGSTIEYRVVKLVMRDYVPPAAVCPLVMSDAECFRAHPACPACFPVPTAKRAKACTNLLPRLGCVPELPTPELDALARIRTACAGVERTLASLAMPEGPTGATEGAPESTGPTAD